jgi:hypothetical protein
MRAVPLLTLLGATSWAGEAFGVWKLNPARSTLVENQKSVTLRIEPHTRGEVFTLDTPQMGGLTVEVRRECANGYTQLIRRSTIEPGVLILEITEQYKDGRRSERRLVMEKQ